MKNFTKLVILVWIMALSIPMTLAQNTRLSADPGDLEETDYRDPGTIIEVPISPAGSSRATGDNCADPIIVSIPASLPYTNVNYTCGRLNNYDNMAGTACLGYYDGGEDIIYRLDVTSYRRVNISLDPMGTTYTGIAIMAGCPDVGPCLSASTGSSGTTIKYLSNIDLNPGSYYIMVDTWPSPACIPNFTLGIVDVTPTYAPIAVFPFTEDFESGAIPPEMYSVINSNALLNVTSVAAAGGSAYGLRYEGNTSVGWTNLTNGDLIFASNGTHIARTEMQVQSNPGPGLLTLRFNLKMTYTYNVVTYAWFRVTVNGVPIGDINGTIYPRPATPSSDPFVEFEYDLTPYQGTTFLVSLESCNK